jgi:DNA topoisomerase I
MTHRLEEDMGLVAESKKTKDDVLTESRDMLRDAYELLAQNAEGVRKTLRGALDRQRFVGPCVLCGGALQLQRSPRGTRWVQCVNNPSTCPATYALPAAGFIEPAPDFLCGTCRVPRVKIVFRGQRPELFCINPECAEHQKAFRFGACPSCGQPLALRYSFAGKRFVGCTGYPACKVTYPLPQRGRLDRLPDPCPACRSPMITVIEARRPPWTLCINPECPTRKAAQAEKEAKAKAREEARAAKAKTKTRSRRAKPRTRATGTGRTLRRRTVRPSTASVPDAEPASPGVSPPTATAPP